MQCKNCESTLSEGSLFCSQCGTKVESEKKFCSNCGHELQENEKFCSQCGVKYEIERIIETATNPVLESKKEVPKEKTEIDVAWDTAYEIEDMFQFIITRLYQSDSASYESIGLIDWLTVDESDTFRDNAPLNVLAQLRDSRARLEIPVFYFDYAGKVKKTGELEEGILFTTRGIRGSFLTMEDYEKWRLVPYDVIQRVEYKHSMLASVIDIYDRQGKKTRFYLTGITNPANFVNCVEHLLRLIRQVKEEKTSAVSEKIIKVENQISDEKVEESSVEQLVKTVCSKAQFTSTYGKSADDLRKSNYEKCDKVVSNFNIPKDETLYLIFDGTILGTCKTGLVLAGDKVYCKDSLKSKVYSWEEFSKIKLEKQTLGNIQIGSDFSLNAATDANKVMSILNEIRENMY